MVTVTTVRYKGYIVEVKDDYPFWLGYIRDDHGIVEVQFYHDAAEAEQRCKAVIDKISDH